MPRGCSCIVAATETSSRSCCWILICIGMSLPEHLIVSSTQGLSFLICLMCVTSCRSNSQLCLQDHSAIFLVPPSYASIQWRLLDTWLINPNEQLPSSLSSEGDHHRQSFTCLNSPPMAEAENPVVCANLEGSNWNENSWPATTIPEQVGIRRHFFCLFVEFIH